MKSSPRAPRHYLAILRLHHKLWQLLPPPSGAWLSPALSPPGGADDVTVTDLSDRDVVPDCEQAHSKCVVPASHHCVVDTTTGTS